MKYTIQLLRYLHDIESPQSMSPGHREDWAGRLDVIIKSQAQQAVPWGGGGGTVAAPSNAKLEDLPV